MRIVAGEYKGRRLVAPPGETTRPILDRVKVALFDWLGAMLAMPGTLPPIDVLDIFCGGGSLGIEALSRGARSCTFVESDAQALGCLRRNLALVGATNRAKVIPGKAESAPIPSLADGFALIFLDPPYRLNDDLSAGSTLFRIMHRLGRDIAVTRDARVIWRHARATPLPTDMAGWTAHDARTWGTMTIALYASPTAENAT